MFVCWQKLNYDLTKQKLPRRSLKFALFTQHVLFISENESLIQLGYVSEYLKVYNGRQRTCRNEWIASNVILPFAQRVLGSPQGKHRCKGTYGERLFWRLKKRFLREIMAFSLQFYHTWIKICWYEGSVRFCWNFYEIHNKKYRKTSLLP